jgi:carboxylesterase
LCAQVEGLETRPKGASSAFLLVHGFCAAPNELASLGEYLESLGSASFAVQLAGHGTTPNDLKRSTWQDWYHTAVGGLDVVRSWNPRRLFVAGFSMGGALSVLLASEEKDIDGLVLIAPALKIDGLLPKLVPFLKHIIKYREIDIVKAQEPYEIKRTKYSREPLSAYDQLFKLQKRALQSLARVVVPTIVIQGTKDRTISPKNGELAYNGISASKKELYMIEDAEHVIPCHWTRNKAYPFIKQFIERVALET